MLKNDTGPGGDDKPMLVVTRELVRRIESEFAANHVRNAERRKANGKIDGFEVRKFGETVALRVPGGGRANHVIGFCHDDVERLDEVLAFFDSDVPTFYLSPAGFSGSVGRALGEAGFYQQHLEQAVFVGLPTPERPAMPSCMTIAPVSKEELELFLETLAQGFGWSEDGKTESRMRFGEPGRNELIARFDGKPVGTAVVTVSGEVGALGPASVVPDFRGKGCHTAMIRARMHLAYELGCTLVHSGASFGSGSFRNQQRAGLTLAYVESIWNRL